MVKQTNKAKPLNLGNNEVVCPNCKTILKISNDLINEDYVQCDNCEKVVDNSLVKGEKGKETNEGKLNLRILSVLVLVVGVLFIYYQYNYENSYFNKKDVETSGKDINTNPKGDEIFKDSKWEFDGFTQHNMEKWKWTGAPGSAMNPFFDTSKEYISTISLVGKDGEIISESTIIVNGEKDNIIPNEDFEFSEEWRKKAYQAAKDCLKYIIKKEKLDCHLSSFGYYNPSRVKYIGNKGYRVSLYYGMICDNDKDFVHRKHLLIEVFYDEDIKDFKYIVLKDRYDD